MFERFTDSARRVVVLAQEEARTLGHNYIGTEHLLLGLVNHGDGISGQTLRWFEITLPAARDAVAEIVGRVELPPSGHIPFTVRAKTVLEHSLREALRLGDDHIGSEHILLALAGEGTGVGCRTLQQLGAAPAAVMAKVLELRDAPDGADEPRFTTSPAAPPVNVLRAGFGPPPGPPATPRCSVCGRSTERVARVLVAGGVLLCDQCVRDAAAQLDALPADGPVRVRFARRDVGPPDERAATEAIQRAFDAVIGPAHVPPAEALWAVEGGAELESLLVLLDSAAARAPVVVNDSTVERVRFVDADEAEVSLGIWMAGTTTPMLHPAHAVREDGTWKVSRGTVEFFARLARQFARPPD